MKSLVRKMARGQGGFTLVELLVVVAILGIIAAVAVLAVTKFIGTGTLEAAKTELHQAQTAVAACLADAGVGTLNTAAVIPAWDGSEGDVIAVGANNTAFDAADYVHGLFRGLYDIDVDGTILAGYPNDWGTGIQWGADGQWEKVP
jgi:type IV pilus assembly protein PilA